MCVLEWFPLVLQFPTISAFFIKPLEIVPSTLITTGITITFMFNSSLSFLGSPKYLSLFCFLWFSLCVPLGRLLFERFSFFFVKNQSVRSSVRMICLYLKISQNFVRLIHLDRFWFVHIPFGCMVKFQFLVQVPVDYLPHFSVLPVPLLLLWHHFCTSAY